MEGWCLHELRHSYLTMLAMEGVHPKVMQELAGHSSSKTTMDIYTHVNMSQKCCAADAIEAVMAGVGPETPQARQAPACDSAPIGVPCHPRRHDQARGRPKPRRPGPMALKNTRNSKKGSCGPLLVWLSTS